MKLPDKVRIAGHDFTVKQLKSCTIGNCSATEVRWALEAWIQHMEEALYRDWMERGLIPKHNWWK